MRATRTLSWLGKTFYWEFRVFDTPSTRSKGVSARIPNTCEFVPFMDYDAIIDAELKRDLPYLQELFELGDFHVLSTGEQHRHVVCVDRLPMREVLQVLWESDCDYNFKRGIRLNEYRTWILRVLAKGNRPRPQYIYSIPSKHNGRNLQSEAHALFLWYYYGVKVRLVKPDGNTELDIQDYLTATKVNMKLAGLARSANWLSLKLRGAREE